MRSGIEKVESRAQSRACARLTLTLALSHQGRGDSLDSIRAWFRLVILVAFWIPAFAGMTGRGAGARTAAAKYGLAGVSHSSLLSLLS